MTDWKSENDRIPGAHDGQQGPMSELGTGCCR